MDEVYFIVGNASAEKVSISASLNSLGVTGWDTISVNTAKLNIPNAQYFSKETNLTNIAMEAKRISSKKISVNGNAQFGDFHIVNDDGILANLTGSSISVASQYEANTLISDFYLKSASSPSAVLDAQLKLSLPNKSLVTCITVVRCNAEFWSDYSLAMESNKLFGSSQCFLTECSMSGSQHVIKSDNTVKFLSASRSKIFSPFLLAAFYSNFQMERK